MTFPEFIERIARRRRLTKKATREVLEDFFRMLALAVWAQGRVYVAPLGTFTVRTRKPKRIGRPPLAHGSMPNGHIEVPGHQVVTCRVSSDWRRRLLRNAEPKNGGDK